jgi:RHS repeat-associated protein
MMGFDALQCMEYVDTYYAGGSGSFGSGPGPNYGVTFSSNAMVLTDAILGTTANGCSSNVTNMPSPYNQVFFLSGSAATMDVPAGFTDGFSFYYNSAYDTGFINVWSGLDGTGTLLATLNLPITGGCPNWPQFCVWDPIGVSFMGTAMSVDFGGTENQISFDNITLGVAVVVNPGKTTGNPSDEPGSCGCGDPISIGNGNLYEKVTDYQSAGANRLAFDRYYNSLGNLESFANTLGAKWRSTYDRYIRIINATTVTVERADGQEVNFNLNGSTWTPDSDVDLSLVQSGNSWILTDKDDTVETYSSISSTEAILQSIKARNGYTQTLTHDSNNFLTAVTDSYNRSLGFTYQNGLLQTVTTPDSLTLSYTYAAAGSSSVLTSVAYSTNPVTSQTYLYENTGLPFALTGITDEDGNRYATWTYDTTGRALTSQHANGADLTTVVYDDTDNSRTVTNALGVTDTYTFTTLQGVPKVTQISRAATSSTAAATESFTYDSNGYLASKTDWNGNQTTYVNDSHGQPTTINEAVGTSVAKTTIIAYDSTWTHLPATVTTAGLTTSFTYDSDGELLTKTLTDTTTTTTPFSTKGQTRTWTNTWSNSLLASVKTPNGNTTKYGYDSTGALTSTTDAAGHLTQITSHTGGGLPLTIVDPNNVTTTLTYSPRLWPLSSTVTGASGTYATTWAYDAAGNLTQTTLPDNSYLANTYDAAHRLTQVTDALGNYTSYTLDALGDRTQTSIFAKGGTTPTWQRTSTFDALGHLLVDKQGAGQTITKTYDPNGNVQTVTDDLSHTTTNTYDALNRLSASTDANSGVTTPAYDAHDRLVSVTDANDNQTSYVRDGFGDVIQQVSPDSGTTVFQYDGDANLTKKTDALSIVTNQTFDALDRVLTTAYPADSAENVTYTYDQTGTGFSFGVGRLTSVTDAAGTLTRTYEERGNLLAEKRVNGKTTLTTSYTYDGANRIASLTYPDGTLVNYQYDAAGYTSKVTAKPAGASSTTTIATLQHQPFGPLNAVTYGNGIAETWAFDSSYRPTSIVDALSGTNVQKLTYAYDNANNVKSITDAVNAANSQTLTYDATNRLLSATSGSGGYGSLTWTYDTVGNRLTQVQGSTTNTYGYTKGSNRLVTISTTSTQAMLRQALPSLRGIGSGSPLWAHASPAGMVPHGSTQPPTPSTAKAASLSSALGWPMVIAGCVGIVGFRKHLRRNKFLALLFIVAILAGAGGLINGCGGGSGGSGGGSNTPQAAAPTFSPTTGTYSSAQSVGISDSTTGATIYYTTDGSTPTASSTQYTAAITVSSTETIKAIATASGYTTSAVSTATYTIGIPIAATPAFSPAAGTYSSAQTVSITDSTAGATIYYTTDGSTPTASSTQYTAAITVSVSETVSAIAIASGYTTSAVATAAYTISLPAAATPTFLPVAGSYTTVQTVAISDSTAGATIYYTTDGTTPTTNSTKYTAAITVSSTETIGAIAVASGYSNSAIATATYTMNIPAVITVTTNANGNITSIPPANAAANATFAYNNANRLESVSGSPLAATFTYDWAGQRITKTNPGAAGPILYSYAQGGTLIAENNNGTVTDTIYADGRPIAMLHPTVTPAANQVSYIVADRLGTPQLASNSSGTTVWATTYQPFGTTGNISASITQNLRFPGQYMDVETGFNYNLNRDYMPNLGRYLETDPIGLVGGMDTFGYAFVNPLIYRDPKGLWAVVDDVVFAGGGALLGIAGQGITDLESGNLSTWQTYTGDALGGAASGETLLYTAPIVGPYVAGIAAGEVNGLVKNSSTQGLNILTHQQCGFDLGSLAADTAENTAFALIPFQDIASGQGELFKLFVNQIPGTIAQSIFDGALFAHTAQ